MAQRNSYRKNQPEDHFNLDDYIKEKSGSSEKIFSEEQEDTEKSSWLRNAALLTVFGFMTLLYFNNWSPMQVYGNIFGVEKYQAGFVAPNDNSSIIVLNGSGEESTIRISGLTGTESTIITEGELSRITENALSNAFQALEGLESLESLESLEELENLESSFAGLENLEEMNELRTFALETAMEALRGIGDSEEFGQEVQSGIQEALRELQNLQQSESIGTDQLVSDATTINASFTQYSDELTGLGITDIFSNSDILKLHQAKVSTSFLKQLDDLNLLEKLDADSIIEAYNTKD